jgi:N-ethylmaleimide reductase
MTGLFSPLTFGPYSFAHRVVMAPLTRMRAGQPGDAPTELAAVYYGQRASAGGLIIAEASQIAPRGKGYPATPGVYSDEQIVGWRSVTEAVHARGGLIFLQLWHVGRASHSSHHGLSPVGPSPIPSPNKVMDAQWRQVEAEIPHPLSTAEIAELVAAYGDAAARAKASGFDGVEIHSANGYLLDQFLHDGSNQRTDSYGGSRANRTRLLLEVVDAAASVWGPDRVGVRLSPYGIIGGVSDSDPVALFTHVLHELDRRGIAYAHLIEPRSAAGVRDVEDDHAPSAIALFRSAFQGVLIGSGSFTRESGTAAVESGLADAIAFGRAFIANPDLPERLRFGAPLNPYNRATFYGGGAAGYVDYPALEPSVA